VGQLAALPQQAVHRGLGRHINAAVSQARHDLARRQILERFAVERGHHGLAFFFTQLVGRTHVAPLARRALVTFSRIRALPALHAAGRQSDLTASPAQTCPVGAGFSDQAEQLLALQD
jgi:hypothetical protein